MGSIGSPNSWAPYANYRDCSQGICSIYCPQWCYIIFPPPPPFPPEDDDHSATNFSPLIIAVIGILASAFLLIAYYTIISKYCKRRRNQTPNPDSESNQNQINQDQFQISSSGLDESLIRSITVCKFKKGDGLVEGTECAVCLSEFVDDESLRLLPKCSHAFHLPCIDTWLKSHSNCPLCRANVVPNQNPVQNSSTLNISSLQIQHQGDLVLVVEEREREEREEVVVGVAFQELRRSVSMGHPLVADILNIDEEDDDDVGD